MTTEDTTVDGPDIETGHRTPDSAGDGDLSGEARLRAGAREDSSPDTETGPSESPVFRRILGRLRGEFRTPQVWAEQPASCRQLLAYAKGSPWARSTGPLRAAGVVWCYGFAIPATFVAYLFAWTAQRPSRAIAVVLIYLVLIQTELGAAVLPPWKES